MKKKIRNVHIQTTLDKELFERASKILRKNGLTWAGLIRAQIENFVDAVEMQQPTKKG